MPRRDLLLETLQEAAGRLGNATLALRGQRPIEAAAFLRAAIRNINVATTELAEVGSCHGPEAD